MKTQLPANSFNIWRHDQLFNIDFASYTLHHHQFSRHFHDYYVIELVVAGKDQFYCGGETYTASDNQIVLINPGVMHTGSTVADTTLRYFSMYPTEKNLQQIAEVLEIPYSGNFEFSKTLVTNPALSRLMMTFFQAINSGKQGDLIPEELFWVFMHDLLSTNLPTVANSKKDGGLEPRIKTIIDYIRAHFNEEISLRQLSALVQLNPYHVIRLFKKAVGVSPYEYLIITRIEHARQLLRTNWPVQDAAIKSGFYDSSHFNRLFKKVAGVAPKTFHLSKCQHRTIFTA